jgi:hypothetical protein
LTISSVIAGKKSQQPLKTQHSFLRVVVSFLQTGIDGTIKFLKCVTCNYHRNFHRKEIVVVNAEQTSFLLKTL